MTILNFNSTNLTPPYWSQLQLVVASAATWDAGGESGYRIDLDTGITTGHYTVQVYKIGDSTLAPTTYDLGNHLPC